MIFYEAVHRPMGKGMMPTRVLKHRWWCDAVYCGQLVWEEPLAGIDETPEQQTDRLARIKAATESHVCPPKETA